MKKHGVSINMPRGMTDKGIASAIAYGAHSSANKEKAFVWRELAEQLQARHVAIFPLSAVRHLHKLCLYPLFTILQSGRKPRLIHDFSWSKLNKIAKAAAQKESMHFGKALHRLLDCILAADLALGPTYLCKVDLADAYMRIWVRVEDVPSVDLLIPKDKAIEEQLVGFHLYILMGYMEYADFFCTATETVKDRAITTLNRRSGAPPYLLEALAESNPEDDPADLPTTNCKHECRWAKLYSQAWAEALAHVEVYLNDFIGITQGGQEEHTHTTRHLFRKIDDIFRPNNSTDRDRLDPIYIKTLKKGDARWSTTKTVLG